MVDHQDVRRLRRSAGTKEEAVAKVGAAWTIATLRSNVDPLPGPGFAIEEPEFGFVATGGCRESELHLQEGTYLIRGQVFVAAQLIVAFEAEVVAAPLEESSVKVATQLTAHDPLQLGDIFEKELIL